jgi:heme-degrading monooxygenase HmoA
MRFTRMIIGEAVSDEVLNEVVARMQEHVTTMEGTVGHSILTEESGRMVILITDWHNRDECMAYHASHAYREFVASTQHMLIGNYVVKMFAKNI